MNLSGMCPMIVIDTHIWIWWVNQSTDKLKPRWMEMIQSSTNAFISSISLFEVSWLVHHKRIDILLPLDEWLTEATDGSGIGIVPISPKIAMTATQLPYHHRDPQDRLIIASAIATKSHLISADSIFPQYQEIADILIN